MSTNPTRRAYLASRIAHKKLMGVEITISRGLTTSAVLTATVGFSGTVSYDADGNSLFARNRDYLIDVVNYKVEDGGDPVDPMRYDTITEVINGVPRTYSVLDDTGDGPYATKDAGLTVWRVHTKEL